MKSALTAKQQFLCYIILAFFVSSSPSALCQDNNVNDTPCCCQNLAGNINADPLDEVDVSDLTALVSFMFKGGLAPACPKEANVDGDIAESIDIADLTALVAYSFKGGPAPAPCLQPVPPTHQLGGDGEIVCNVDFGPPCASPYILPFPAGKTFKNINSYCAPVGGHVNWFAYDFNTQMGDTIIACRSGLVTFSFDGYADTDFTCGHENNVFIRHSDGTVIRYTHLLNGGNMVTAGQTVAQGQPIALSGRSGCTGGVPHLHLALFNDGTSYDRQNSICMNFRNGYGYHDTNNGLVTGELYLAEPF